MKYLSILLIFLLLSCVKSKPSEEHVSAKMTSNYDSLLAKKLGADQYGMRQYVMAFLKAGPNRDQDSTTAAQLQKAHMDNIVRMAEEGKLAVAGPFMDNGDIRGIYIFAVETIEEAEALTLSDPAIQEGRLTMELNLWYGSAALMQVNDIHLTLSENPL